MNLSGETLTVGTIRFICAALQNSAQQVRCVVLMAENGDLSPEAAAQSVNAILAKMQFDMLEAHDPAPPMPESLTALITAGPAG